MINIMKYIRTKDGIIDLYNINLSYMIVDNYIDFNSLGRYEIIKQADTIEELCDGFWWENTMYKEPIFIPNYLLALDRFNAWKESDKELKSNSLDRITIYGSIYIKGKGWVHVAKMNEKGELELL